MRRGVGVLALACMTVAATATGSAAEVDPCLLTVDELEAEFDTPFVQDFAGAGECSYVSESDDPGVGVGLQVGESTSKRDAKAHFKDLKSVATDAVRVKGVGKGAYYARVVEGVGDVVVFWKGTTVVSITLLIPTEQTETHRDEIVAVAKAAARNL